MRNTQALSPILAAILLIALTVAVSIAVGLLWLRTIQQTTPQTKIHYINTYEGFAWLFRKNNITVLQSTIKFDFPITIQVRNFTDFLEQMKLDNVTYVLTDYQPPEVPHYLEKNTAYVLTQYNFWYYIEIEHVGKAAVICPITLSAFYGGD